MDREQEDIQFLGCFGILRESCNIVSSWRKIFSQIALFLIVPLAFIYLVHIQIEELLFIKILHNDNILANTPQGSRSYNQVSDLLSSEWTTYFFFKIGYLLFVIILALLSTSAVVYTIASIYTAKDLTLRKVMSIVPIVWKRLMVTFIWSFIVVFAYNFVSILILFIASVLIGQNIVLGIVFAIVFVFVYLAGIVYISMIWHLASVVSVLEEKYGLNAMEKSRDLIRGKMGVTVAVFLLLGICFTGVQLMFKYYVVIAHGQGVWFRIMCGMLSLGVMATLMLFGLVVQTILYFVCKSYHHESIDKSSLADHLGGYLGEYVPLKTKDVQLEHFEV